MKILIVDDNSDLRGMLWSGFKNYGLEVVEAKNGVEALKLLETFSPYFVLTDIQMPEMDGLEFLEKARLKFPGLPVFVMTGNSIFDEAQIIKLGASGYFEKTSIIHLINVLGQRFGDVSSK